MSVKTIAVICGVIVFCVATSSDIFAQEMDRGTINTDGIDELKSTLKKTDGMAQDQQISDDSAGVIELKNGSLVPALRLDGRAAKKAATGAIIYGRGVYVTDDGVVRSNGKIVKQLAQGERLSVGELEDWSRKERALPSTQGEEGSSVATGADTNVSVSDSGFQNLPTPVSPEPNGPVLRDEPLVERGTIPVGRERKVEYTRAGTIYNCPDRVKVDAHILPDPPGRNNRNDDHSIWILNGDGTLPVSASELDVSPGGEVYFPICYYGGAPDARSQIFTIIEVDRDAYKFCVKETRFRDEHSYFCSPDKDWLNKFGNASLHNQELNLDDAGTRADIAYETQPDGRAILQVVPPFPVRLAILPSGNGSRGACAGAVDDFVTAIPQDELRPGRVVCYKTGNARFGYLTVVGHLPGKPDSIVFNYRTFAKFD